MDYELQTRSFFFCSPVSDPGIKHALEPKQIKGEQKSETFISMPEQFVVAALLRSICPCSV
jgi:hypothetical protein